MKKFIFAFMLLSQPVLAQLTLVDKQQMADMPAGLSSRIWNVAIPGQTIETIPDPHFPLKKKRFGPSLPNSKGVIEFDVVYSVALGAIERPNRKFSQKASATVRVFALGPEGFVEIDKKSIPLPSFTRGKITKSAVHFKYKVMPGIYRLNVRVGDEDDRDTLGGAVFTTTYVKVVE
jgi:hypothetical protein